MAGLMIMLIIILPLLSSSLAQTCMHYRTAHIMENILEISLMLQPHFSPFINFRVALLTYIVISAQESFILHRFQSALTGKEW